MSRTLHVLQVAKSGGGVGEYLRWLVNGLDKGKFRLTVVCLSDEGAELAAELSRSSKARTFSLPMNRYKIDPLSDGRACLHVAKLIRQERFDLIHAHASKPGFIARLAAVGTGTPVIYSPHCFAFHAGAGQAQAMLFAGLENLAARYLTTRIVCVSEAERKLARQYRVGRDDQFIMIHSGIDTMPFNSPVDYARVRASLGVPSDAPLVGAVGRLNAQKAPLDFVAAAAQVHAIRPDVHFIWVGAGPLEAQTRAAVLAQGLMAVFHFAGQRNDVPQIMRAMDFFALPSHWESFPLTVLEAMAAGIPVVATNVMGIPEAVSVDETGLLVSPRNPAEFAQALLQLLDDPDRARRLGACGRQRVERKFTRQQMIAHIEQLYEEVYASHNE